MEKEKQEDWIFLKKHLIGKLFSTKRVFKNNILEELFTHYKFVSSEQKRALAEVLGLSYTQVRKKKLPYVLLNPLLRSQTGSKTDGQSGRERSA